MQMSDMIPDIIGVEVMNSLEDLRCRSRGLCASELPKNPRRDAKNISSDCRRFCSGNPHAEQLLPTFVQGNNYVQLVAIFLDTESYQCSVQA
jgi:hypothetical protein